MIYSEEQKALYSLFYDLNVQKNNIQLNQNHQNFLGEGINSSFLYDHEALSKRQWRRHSNINNGIKVALESLDNDIALVFQQQIFKNYSTKRRCTTFRKLLKDFENENNENWVSPRRKDRIKIHHMCKTCIPTSSPRIYGGVSNLHCQTSQKEDAINEDYETLLPLDNSSIDLLESKNLSTTKKLPKFGIIEILENVESSRRKNKEILVPIQDYKEIISKNEFEKIENDETFHSNKPQIASLIKNDDLNNEKPLFQEDNTKKISPEGKEKGLQYKLVSDLTNVASTSTETFPRISFDNDYNESFKDNTCHDPCISPKKYIISPKINLYCCAKSQPNNINQKQEKIQVGNKTLESTSSFLTTNQIKETNKESLNSLSNNRTKLANRCLKCLEYKNVNFNNEFKAPNSLIQEEEENDCGSWTSCWKFSPRTSKNTHISKNDISCHKSSSNADSRQSSPNSHELYCSDKQVSNLQNCWGWNPKNKENENFIEEELIRFNLESSSSTSEGENNLKTGIEKIEKETIFLNSPQNVYNKIQPYNHNVSVDDKNVEIFKEVIVLEVEEQPKSGYYLTSIHTTQHENSVKIEVSVVKDNDFRSANLPFKNQISMDTPLDKKEDIDKFLNSNENASTSSYENNVDAPLHHDNAISNTLEDLTNKSIPFEDVEMAKKMASCKNEDFLVTNDEEINLDEPQLNKNKHCSKNKCNCWGDDLQRFLKIDSNIENIEKAKHSKKIIDQKNNFVGENNTSFRDHNTTMLVNENTTTFVDEDKAILANEKELIFVDKVDKTIMKSMEEKKINEKNESYKCWNVCTLDEKTKIGVKEEKVEKVENDVITIDKINNSTIKKDLMQKCNDLSNISQDLNVIRKNEGFVTNGDIKRGEDILNNSNDLSIFIRQNPRDETKNMETKRKTSQDCSFCFSSMNTKVTPNHLSLEEKNDDYAFNDFIHEADKSEVDSSNSIDSQDQKLDGIKILNDNKRPSQTCSCWSPLKVKKKSNEFTHENDVNSIKIDNIIETKSNLLQNNDTSTSTSTHQPCEHCQLVYVDKYSSKRTSMTSEELFEKKNDGIIEILDDKMKDEPIDLNKFGDSTLFSKHNQNKKVDNSFNPMTNKNLTKGYDCWPLKKMGTSNNSPTMKKDDCNKLNQLRDKEQDTKDLEVLNSYLESTNHKKINKVDKHCGKCINAIGRINSHIDKAFQNHSNEDFQETLQGLSKKKESSATTNIESHSYEVISTKDFINPKSQKNQANDNYCEIVSNSKQGLTLSKSTELQNLQDTTLIEDKMESNQYAKSHYNQIVEKMVEHENEGDLPTKNEIEEETIVNSKNFDDTIVTSKFEDDCLIPREFVDFDTHTSKIDNDNKHVAHLKDRIETIENNAINKKSLLNESQDNSLITNSTLDVIDKSDKSIEDVGHYSKNSCWNCTSIQFSSIEPTKHFLKNNTKQNSTTTKDIISFDNSRSLSLESIKNKSFDINKTSEANNEKTNEEVFGGRCWWMFSPHSIKEALLGSWIGRSSKSNSPTLTSSPTKSSISKETKQNCTVDEAEQLKNKIHFGNTLLCYNLLPCTFKNYENKSKIRNDIFEEKTLESKETETLSISNLNSINKLNNEYNQAIDTTLEENRKNMKKNTSIMSNDDELEFHGLSMSKLEPKNNSLSSCFSCKNKHAKDELQYKLEKLTSNELIANELQSSKSTKPSHLDNEMSKKLDFDKSLDFKNSDGLKEYEAPKTKELKPTNCLSSSTSTSNSIIHSQNLDNIKDNDNNLNPQTLSNLLVINNDVLEEESKQTSASSATNASNTRNKDSHFKTCECFSSLPFKVIYSNQNGLQKQESKFESNALIIKGLNSSNASVNEEFDFKTSTKLLNLNNNASDSKNKELKKLDSSIDYQVAHNENPHELKVKDEKSNKSACWSLPSCIPTNKDCTPHKKTIKEPRNCQNVDMHLIQSNLEKFETNVFSNDFENFKEKENDQIKTKDMKSRSKSCWPSLCNVNNNSSPPHNMSNTKTKTSKIISNDQISNNIDNLNEKKSSIENIELEVFTTNIEKNKIENSKILNFKALQSKNNTCWSSFPCNKKFNINSIKSNDFIDKSKEIFGESENQLEKHNKESINTKLQSKIVTQISDKDFVEDNKVYSQDQEVYNTNGKNVLSSNAYNILIGSSQIQDNQPLEESKVDRLNFPMVIQDLNDHVQVVQHENATKISSSLSTQISDIPSNKDKMKHADKDEENMNITTNNTNESKKFENISKSKRVNTKMSSVSSKSLEKVLETKLNNLSNAREFQEITINKSNIRKKCSKIKQTTSPSPETFYKFLTSDSDLKISKKVQSKIDGQESKLSCFYPSMTKTQKSNNTYMKQNVQSINNHIPKISLKFQKCDAKQLGENSYKMYSEDLFLALQEHELRLLKGKKITEKNDSAIEEYQSNIKIYKNRKRHSKKSQSTQHSSCISYTDESNNEICQDNKDRSSEVKGPYNKHQIIKGFDSSLESQKSLGEIDHKNKEDFQVDENETLKSLESHSLKKTRIQEQLDVHTSYYENKIIEFELQKKHLETKIVHLEQAISSKDEENKTLVTQLQKLQSFVEELQSKNKNDENDENNANIDFEKKLVSTEFKYNKFFNKKENIIEELKVNPVTNESKNKYLVHANESEYKSLLEKIPKTTSKVEEKNYENNDSIAKINECQSIIHEKNNIIEKTNEDKSKLHPYLNNAIFSKEKEIEEFKVEQLNIKNKTIVEDEAILSKQNENKNVNQVIEVLMENSNLDKHTISNDLLSLQDQNIILESDILKEFNDPKKFDHSNIQNENFIISEELLKLVHTLEEVQIKLNLLINEENKRSKESNQPQALRGGYDLGTTFMIDSSNSSVKISFGELNPNSKRSTFKSKKQDNIDLQLHNAKCNSSILSSTIKESFENQRQIETIEFEDDYEFNFDSKKDESFSPNDQMAVQNKDLLHAIHSFLVAQSQIQEFNERLSLDQNHNSQIVYEELVEIKKGLQHERQSLASERHNMVVQAKSMIEATQVFLHFTSQMQLSCLQTKVGATSLSMDYMERKKCVCQTTKICNPKICRKELMIPPLKVSIERNINEWSVQLQNQNNFLKEASQILNNYTNGTNYAILHQ